MPQFGTPGTSYDQLAVAGHGGALTLGANSTLLLDLHGIQTTGNTAANITTFTPTGLTGAFGQTTLINNPNRLPATVQAFNGAGHIDVTLVGLTLALTSSLNPANLGQAVTFTATITPFSSSPNPTGTITFTDNGTAIGNVTVSTSGNITSAALLDSNLTFGDHTILASYSGDANYAPATAQLLQFVNGDFDFAAVYSVANPPGVSPTQPGYVRVSQTHSFDGTIGWLNPLPTSVDRNQTAMAQPGPGVPNYLDLLQAFQSGTNNTFEAALPNGNYTVTLTLGDAQLAHNNITVNLNGANTTFLLGNGTSTALLSSPAGQFITATANVSVGNGTLNVTLNKDANYQYDSWVLNALDIRPADSVRPLTLTASAPNQNGLVTVSGTGADPNALVTVAASVGTITTTDQEGNYAGTQVVADANGNFTYTVLETTQGSVTFSAQEVNGASFGNTTQTVVPPLHFQFGAVFNANGGSGHSPSQTTPFPYTDVVSTPYSSALHYGWLNTPGNYDRGAATLQAPAGGAPNYQPLLEAFNDGPDNTFEVDLLGGTTYTFNVTLGDSNTSHGPVEILADGSLVPSITLGNGTTVSTLSSPRGQFLTGSFQVTAPAGSGLQPVTLEFKAINGAADFVLNALDIVQTQNPITLTASAPLLTSVNGQLVPLVTVSGSGATPNSLVTVGASLGTITTADQEGNYAGTQVVADSNGNFTYTVLETATGLATFSAQEVDGASFGNTTQTVVPPLHFQFGAVFNANGGGGHSPSQTTPFAYTDVVSTPYSSALHYGWLNTPGNYDRGNATLGTSNFQPLLEAFNDGSDNTFEVDLLGGTTYTFNVTMGDSNTSHGPVEILADGSLVPSITLGDGTTVSTLSSPRGQFLTGSFQVTAPAGSGLQAVTLEFKAVNGAADFVLNALDIVQTQNVITLTKTGESFVNGFEVLTISGQGLPPIPW